MSKQITIQVEAVGSGAVLCPRIEFPMNTTMKDVVSAIESKIGPTTCFLPDVLDPCSIGTTMDFKSETFFPFRAEVVSAYRICPACAAEVTTSISSGHLECLKYHLCHGQSVTEDLFDVAVEHGRLDLLEYLADQICSLSEVDGLCEIAIEHNHVDCLKFLYKHGCPIDPWMIELAVELGHFECLPYFVEIGEIGRSFDFDTFVAAIKRNRQKCLQFMVQHSDIPDGLGYMCIHHNTLTCLGILYRGGYRNPDLDLHAARIGRLDFLEFLYENNHVWNLHAMDNAAKNGHLDCLRFLRENGADFTEDTITHAAKQGHFECLVFLHEHDCPWDQRPLWHAARKGDLHMVEYLVQNGCPQSKRTTQKAMEYGQLEALRYLFKHGCPFYDTIPKGILDGLPLATARYYRTVMIKKPETPSTPTKRKKPM